MGYNNCQAEFNSAFKVSAKDCKEKKCDGKKKTECCEAKADAKKKE